MMSLPTRALCLFLLCGLSLSACSRRETFQVVLSQDEKVAAGDPVYLDALQVGTVTRVGDEGGDHVADVQIDVSAAGEKLRDGIVRVPVAGRIQLKADAVTDNARPLSPGARIPTRSALVDTIISYSGRSTLMAVGIALALLVVLYLVFKSLVGAIGLVICTAVSAVLTQVVYLPLAPWVLRIYERFPVQDAGASLGGSPPASSSAVGQAMSTVSEVMRSRPDPRMVAWCLVFLATFIVLNIVLGRVARVWKR